MKIIKILNTIAIGLPIALLLSYPLIKESAFYYALISTILTGFIQVVLSIIMLFKNPKNINIYIYLFFVMSFFLMWRFSLNSDFLFSIAFIIPVFLAVYLTFIILKTKKNEP